MQMAAELTHCVRAPRFIQNTNTNTNSLTLGGQIKLRDSELARRSNVDTHTHSHFVANVSRLVHFVVDNIQRQRGFHEEEIGQVPLAQTTTSRDKTTHNNWPIQSNCNRATSKITLNY